MTTAGWRDEVLKFWFEELSPEDWYSGKPEVDERIRERFAGLPAELKATPPAGAQSDPMTALAAIIVFDQFPRNLFRKQPQAFATDPLAARISRHAVDADFDRGMAPAQKQFLYMPLMHSETLADQERCVELFRGLGNEDGLKYAVEHRDIIARFGRFPHRNRALGRETTPEEADFLTGHSGYGQ
jgi:uncharacterized protein (DUF924 family)